MYQLSFTCPNDYSLQQVQYFEDALYLIFDAVSSFKANDGKTAANYEIQAFSQEPVEEALIAQTLQNVASLNNLAHPNFSYKELPKTNWLQENEQHFPPLKIGRFYFYGSHIQDKPPAGCIPILINAATAFGSGNHNSTVGCLEALEELYKRSLKPKRILDMGAGSGILAMAAAKLWPQASILAVDYDAESVRVSKQNCTLNQVPHIQNAKASGYRPPVSGQYDLIFSNILARPLCKFAPEMVQHLRSGGYNISAGLLASQSNKVEHAYQQQRVKLLKRYPKGDWMTILVQKA